MENINKLEKEYASFVGSKYAVAVSSGTAALHVSLVALGIGPGDEVIVPDFSMAAIGFSVSYTGAKVVTVDCDGSLNIDPNLIEAKINERTKAILVVHTYGRLAQMDTINKMARARGLYVIEDGCEAQGAAKAGKSDVLVFSLYKNKIIHAEEGGIICTDSKEIADNIRDLKNMAFGDKHNYYHARIGFNYRMPDSQAKLALNSLHSYERNAERRSQFEDVWNNLIPTKKRDAVWVYDFRCASGADRDAKIAELTEKGVQWRYFFKPLSTMPMFKQEVGVNALDYSNRGLYICYHE
jgi:dTDP-4-amino-4,6-dideoxygalactose transaminase